MLELKLLPSFLFCTYRAASNRTMLELKFVIKLTGGNMQYTSNRTMLELKYKWKRREPPKSRLLIVPCWN